MFGSLRHQRPLLLTGVVGLLCFFLAGFFVGGKTFQAEMVEKRQLNKSNQQLSSALKEIEQQLVNAEVASEVDRAALEETRRQVVLLQQQLSDDEAELALYRNLMQDDTLTDGLLVRELVLEASPESGIAYQLVLQQKTSSLKPISVRVEMRVEGELDGEEKVYSLDQLDSKVLAQPLEMKFKYFEVHRGVLDMPEGFTPHVVTVDLWQSGRKSKKVQRIFGWRTERIQ